MCVFYNNFILIEVKKQTGRKERQKEFVKMIKNTVLVGFSSVVASSHALIDLDHASEHHTKLAEEHHADAKLLFTPSHI